MDQNTCKTKSKSELADDFLTATEKRTCRKPCFSESPLVVWIAVKKVFANLRFGFFVSVLHHFLIFFLTFQNTYLGNCTLWMGARIWQSESIEFTCRRSMVFSPAAWMRIIPGFNNKKLKKIMRNESFLHKIDENASSPINFHVILTEGRKMHFWDKVRKMHSCQMTQNAFWRDALPRLSS